MLAGLQITVGCLSVAPPSPSPSAFGPTVPMARDATPMGVPAPSTTDVTFAVRPPFIQNELWLVFRGTRDRRTGCLVGEVLPDFQMRLLGLVPSLAMTIGAIWATTAGVVLPMLRGGQPSVDSAGLALALAAFTIGWTRSYGAAVQEAALNIRRDSPRAMLTWRPGLRCGSRSPAAPPPPPARVGTVASGGGQDERSPALA